MSAVTLLYYIKRGRLQLSCRVNNEVYNFRSERCLVFGPNDVSRWNIPPGRVRGCTGVNAYALVCKFTSPLVGLLGRKVVVKYFLCVLGSDGDDAVLQ